MRAVLLSWIYRRVRHAALSRHSEMEAAIDWGDRQVHRWYWAIKGWFSFSCPKSCQRSLYDLHFPSPLIVSSFKDDPIMLDLWCRLGMGAAIYKTILKDPRPGNDKPRIQHLHLAGKDHIINAMGLPGKGVAAMAADFKGHPQRFKTGRPVGISIGGHSVQEYEDNLLQMDESLEEMGAQHYFFELNISCPNTPDGQNMMKNHQLLDQLLHQLRQHTQAVIGVKLSPDLSDKDLVKMGEIIAAHDRTYINIGNTSFRHCEEVGLDSDALFIGGGGLSGPTLFDRTLAMTQLLAPLGCPILATGGVSTPQHLRALLNAGATLIGMATQLVVDPFQVPRFNRAIAEDA